MSALPEPARLKFQRLLQGRDDADALKRSVLDSIRACEVKSQRQANAARAAYSDADREAAQHQIELLSDERRRLMTQLDTRNAALQRLGQLCGRIENWLGRPRTLRAVAQRTVTYTPQELSKAREKIAATQAEIERVTALSLDRASIEKLVTAHVARIGGAVEVRCAGERGDSPFDIALDSRLRGLHRLAAIEVLAWWDPKALVAKLLAAIPVAEGMSAVDKAATIERLQETLLSTERQEEALIEAAATQGAAIERRPDADPRAVLGVTVVKVQEANAA